MTFLSACRQFDTAHTGLAIADKLMEVLKDYGIENKTFHCLTDSASNMIKGSSSILVIIMILNIIYIDVISRTE